MKAIDFTTQVPSAQQFARFSNDVTEAVRKGSGNLIVIDTVFGSDGLVPHLVSDHLNLTGSNPLLGPNDACGQRFPVINDVYITDPPSEALRALPKGVVAAIKSHASLSDAEKEKIGALGAQFFCHNLVPTMIVAAHMGRKVIGILLPQGEKISPEILAGIKELSDREIAR